MGVLNYTPATETDGTVINGTAWTTEITTPFTTLQSARTSYTPTVSGTTVGTGGTVTGRYNRIGKAIWFRAVVTLGSSGFTVGTTTVSLPVTALDTGWNVNANALHAATRYGLSAVCLATGTVTILIANTSPMANLTTTTPFTWAATDVITIDGWYEAA